MFNENKPLGHRSYGSIPHLPGSRVGPSDYHIHECQAKIATEKTRDKNDIVIVQEKLDGSNVGIANVSGKIYAITRSGYLASTSTYSQHHIFSEWVRKNEEKFLGIIGNGERICGEWMAMAHGTLYNLKHEPFVAFDLVGNDNKRINYELFIEIISNKLITPNVIHIGPIQPQDALNIMGQGKHGAIDPVEGIIYRVERKREVDFLTKYVRPDKVDGKYLAENNGTGECIWNSYPKF